MTLCISILILWHFHVNYHHVLIYKVLGVIINYMIVSLNNQFLANRAQRLFIYCCLVFFLTFSNVEQGSENYNTRTAYFNSAQNKLLNIQTIRYNQTITVLGYITVYRAPIARFITGE